MTHDEAVAPAERHSQALMALHWAMAALLVGLFAVGFVMTGVDPDDPARLWLSRAHVLLGVSTGVAIVARLIVRTRSTPLAPLPMAPPRRALLRVVHGGIYVALFALLASGVATCALGDWSSYVVFGTTASAPDLHAIPTRAGHEIFAFSLLAMVSLHIAGVMLHEVRVGGALRRMLPLAK